MPSYYNEIDPFAAQWLRELIKQGHIADGTVDERSIEDVRPSELAGYTQCHFFAGIGVWSYALRQAGWPDDRPAWTGSCPCQPFSSAGKGAGFADERHLWPAFHWLIDQCRPVCVLGEQVAGKDGLAWLDLVSADLEGSGYACGPAVTAACGFGAPQKRTRLYWVGIDPLADTSSTRVRQQPGSGACPPSPVQGEERERQRRGADGSCGSPTGSMADTKGQRSGEGQPDTRRCAAGSDARQGAECVSSGEPGSMADTNDTGSQGWSSGRNGTHKRPTRAGSVGGEGPGPTNGFWRDADRLGCRDGKWRPVEPGTFPLAHGATSRVGRLRGYGNAIVAQQAQAFIEAFMQKQ